MPQGKLKGGSASANQKNPRQLKSVLTTKGIPICISLKHIFDCSNSHDY